MLTLQDHRSDVCSLAYSPTSRTLASGGADKTVRLWDLTTRQTTAILKGHRTYVHAVAFSPDGKVLASAAGDLYLRDPATGAVAIARQETGRPVAGLSFSADGRLLVTVDRRLGGANSILAGDMQFWDTATAAALLAANPLPRRKGETAIPPAERLRQSDLGGFLYGHRHHLGAWSVALDPTGMFQAVGTDYRGVLLWDLHSSSLPTRLNTAAAVRALAFTSDGRLLAAAEASRIQVWDGRTGQSVAVLKGHEKQVWSIAFAPHSTAERATLFSGSQDGTVRVWDVNPPRERAVFSWQIGAVRAVAAAPDGMTAAAAGENGSVIVWDCDE
ncbi:MAG TPA: WD40 repeat domain-containing protein [Gemmataceae bacterium]